MATGEGITDRSLGYVGLFLIGAISWAAERLGPSRRRLPVVRVGRLARPSATPDRGLRSAIPMAPRTGG